jgi:hypothetical protein
MNASKLTLWARRALVALAVVTAAGYASSIASVGRCEAHAAHAIARELGGREVFLLPENAADEALRYPGADRILRSAGFSIRPCVRLEDLGCLPWAGVATADVIGPFVVDVRWGYVAGPTIGAGRRTRYLALFGLVLPLQDDNDWPFAI